MLSGLADFLCNRQPVRDFVTAELGFSRVSQDLSVFGLTPNASVSSSRALSFLMPRASRYLTTSMAIS